MSKLDELINELCPEGVEWKKISDICNISRGIVISKDDIRNNIGEYPVYSSQTENNGELGKISTFAYEGEYLTWTTDGANAGTVFYRTGKFNVTNVCGLLKIAKLGYSSRYVYHVLRVEAPKYVRSGMGNPKLMSNVMGDIQIPLPPLPIQEEIVRILDNFTELTAELTAELTDRKKQYEYYRDELLTFGDKVEWKKIGDFSKCYAGATPKTKNMEYWQNGTIPWMSSGEVNLNQIYNTEKKITRKGYNNSSTKMVPANSVVIALAGQGKTRGLVAITRIALCTNQSLCSILPNEKVNNNYLYYYMKTQYQNLRLISSGNGTRGGLNLKMIKNYSVPVPPLEEQERIVAILDRFNTLCNDISTGLPAEIEARQQQYEYYRDKLLTFPKKEA